MDFYMIAFVFFIFFAISSVLNVLLNKNMTKRHWGFSVVVCAGFTLITVAVLGM
ncbi:hypothetical protein [Alteribacter keqinensis]|uniref:hypothetical protein n=1 Tax=Alteribacter keqinensis TaxID=2483800 RepID=UPI001605BE4B|nr:hypothetical protein [Alteribacter keqinensis]